MNNLAWILATTDDAGLRNVAEAVRLSEKACSLTDNKNANLVDTLSVAYAAAGRISDAIGAAAIALDLAYAQKDDKLICAYIIVERWQHPFNRPQAALKSASGCSVYETTLRSISTMR